MKREHLCTRSIKVDTFTTDDGAVLVEGTLEDTLRSDIEPWPWEKVSVGPLHRMAMRMLVDPDAPQILEAEAQVLQGPLVECAEVVAPAEKLAGLHLGPGFIKAVKDRIGATDGCSHLTALATEMSAAGMQGWVINKRRNPMPPVLLGAMIQGLQNSCNIWRVDGPHYHPAMVAIEQMEEPPS